ncbi:Cleft lip and palate transmembrane protein 1-like protein [Trachymyrmex zeteki]|uniref:Lipid scramblase CLPTM1L n=1 Tax=Mycetomoellerius zeteki TaxID=64791 RepID=A0A151WS41_9HYME|nr:PREDICTED: cleft lip and palate transmembrane protein 1-like protein [Trachymyrmex zeteki]XP_018310254.1 PREDICTED: cleft lip and palate transmembrane protein 1-like protein [Trachymyrmex zeteki]XP_018310256.1 PREDICTED: cleft lip and palate transmembrane protein 1-like protein [Trachymyrmex zeteki]XP_018310257.1 PREDICTED: cleft lip and palate transmembrane protein 1-like protein [Trachymyrmex zeteki]XP_018310258.1 PREDICTED: cleft lip and palate transmembrane protein 1-like protein [Trachy
MQWPSLSVILSEIFLAYIVYSIYTLSLLFVSPACEDGKLCLESYLSERPQLDLYMYSSVKRNPVNRDTDLVYSAQNFDYNQMQIIPVILTVPHETRRNGTLFLHIFLVPPFIKQDRTFVNLQKDIFTSYTAIKMTQYIVPEAEAFKLLGDRRVETANSQIVVRPVSHMKSRVTFTIMTDNIMLPIYGIPAELVNHIKIIGKQTFLPIVNCDFLRTRHRDLQRITPQNNTMNVAVEYSPVSLGKLRLVLHVQATMENLKNLGFSDRDVDEVKGIFADTNIYLLGGTFFIAAVHLLFDFLAIKNDVSFWRKKSNLIGLSKWTVIWRAFSQTVIFLYLCEEASSLLVLIPTGISTIIELWKLKKMSRVELISSGNIFPRIRFKTDSIDAAEMKTREFDAESMRYLNYLLYPLVIVGAIYSLLYQPHKSWYSWSINSLVNGVYAFGFLFMLPQLFVNYKLKSVAHLPWKAFMYKAFNTFIDDVFAFIITMPTAHKIACFRDDAVFLIYLYQRWLYPVDKSRVDTDTITEEAVDSGNNMHKKTN